MEIVGEAADGAEAITRAGEIEIDIVLLDIRLPDTDGFAVAKSLRDAHYRAPIIMLTGYDSELYAKEAIELGVRGFLNKNCPRNLLLNSIRVVRDGGTVFKSDCITDSFRSLLQTSHDTPGKMGTPSLPRIDLTEREHAIITGISEGLTNKEIARLLGLAEVTIKKATITLMRKLGVSNRTKAALLARELGLAK